MTVRECYSIFHGNYEEAKERFKTDERIKKLLFLFLKDEHYGQLVQAMDEGDGQDSFLAAHTLKGMCSNLALSVLLEETKALTELLRGGECSSEAMECYERVKENYILTRDAIEELKNGE